MIGRYKQNQYHKFKDKHWLLDSYQFLLSFLGDSPYRNKLKNRLKSEFGDQISFLLSEDKKPEVVVATTSLTSTSFYHDPDNNIKRTERSFGPKYRINSEIIHSLLGHHPLNSSTELSTRKSAPTEAFTSWSWLVQFDWVTKSSRYSQQIGALYNLQHGL